jgi:hypothetical protein
MITKRLIHEPIERIDSAISRLCDLADDAYENGHAMAAKKMHEIISRDLYEAKEKLEYVQEMAS